MLVARLTGVDPEAGGALLVEGAQGAERAGALPAQLDPAGGDHVGQRALPLERLGVDAGGHAAVSCAPGPAGPARPFWPPPPARRAARAAPTERPPFRGAGSRDAGV